MGYIAQHPTEKEYMFHVKIFYHNGKHKYANLLEKKHYDFGVMVGSIVGHRPMNWLERFVFRNCL